MVSNTLRPHFTPGKDPVPILQEAGWDPRLVWTGGNPLPHRDSIPDRPARNQSLYRLSYPAHIYGNTQGHYFIWAISFAIGRGIALLFHDCGTRRELSGQQNAPAALYPRERPGIHFTVGWVGPRAGLDGRKSSSSPGFDPGPSSP